MGISSRRRQVTTGLVLLAALGVTVPLLAADPRSRVLAVNTLLLSTAVAVASVVIGTPLAFLLSRTDIPGRRWPARVLLALLFMPLYLQAAAWQAGFGLQGWCTQLVGTVLLDGWRGAITVHALAAVPWVVLIVGVALRLAEVELEEGALLDAPPSVVFRRVTLARAASGLAVALLWVAVATAGEMTVTDLFRIRTYAEELYTEFALGDADGLAPWRLLPSIVATAWVVVAVLTLTSWLLGTERQFSVMRTRPFRLGPWRLPATIGLWLAIGVLAGVPIGSLVTKAGMIVTREGQELSRHWSAGACAKMIADSPLRFSREFGWSLAAALPAATGATLVAIALAWYARRGGWRAAPAWLAIAGTLATPGTLVGLGLIAVFNDPEWPWLIEAYDHSLVVIWIAQAFRALPLATLVLWYALRTIPAELLQSATLEGANAWSRLVRVALPERWPAVVAAWLVATAVAWGELSATIIVEPPGVLTLPVQIFGLIHYGVDDRVAGIALVSMGGFFCWQSFYRELPDNQWKTPARHGPIDVAAGDNPMLRWGLERVVASGLQFGAN